MARNGKSASTSACTASAGKIRAATADLADDGDVAALLRQALRQLASPR